MENKEYRIRNISFSIAFSIVLLMIIVYLLDNTFHLKLYEYGLHPRKLSGLLGIFTSPFIHSTRDYSHILNNSVPMFVLTWLLFYTYRTVATKVFVLIFLFTGLLVWIFARPSFHIGMSGVIYGLTSFLIVSGFIRKDLRSVSLSLLVIFLYGSLIWGVFPLDPQISWEGHFFGFLTGVILAVVFRKAPPQPQKYFYELQEELGIEEEYEYPYWLENTNTENENQPELINEKPITIHYTYKPKQPSE
jgi:membrane associated rhomboid family serine protease